MKENVGFITYSIYSSTVIHFGGGQPFHTEDTVGERTWQGLTSFHFYTKNVLKPYHRVLYTTLATEQYISMVTVLAHID